MIISEIVIPDPIEYIAIGKKKPKKYYLTANIFYGTVHHFIRADIVTKCKWFLHNHLIDVPKINVPIFILIEYHTEKNGEFDIDNKGYFWGKIIQDWLVKNKKISGDSVKNIQGVVYLYKRGKPKLVIKIIDIEYLLDFADSDYLYFKGEK